jgi:hypothetical protein
MAFAFKISTFDEMLKSSFILQDVDRLLALIVKRLKTLPGENTLAYLSRVAVTNNNVR